VRADARLGLRSRDRAVKPRRRARETGSE